MLRQILSIFRGDDPLGEMGEDFARMLQITEQMTLSAGQMFFGGAASPEARSALYEQDIEVNRLERTIRKKVATHLAVRSEAIDVPYCLFLMGLVKDVERLGDYAKNLSEVRDVYSGPLPEDDLMGELSEIRSGVEQVFRSSSSIVSTSHEAAAVEQIQRGRALASRCDKLVVRIAASEHNAGVATALVLATRYYKRLGGHVINVLSSVVMPVHKVDFFDEDEIPEK